MEEEGSTLDLLEQVIRVEKALTESLERVEPWLRSSKSTNPRVRPLPTNLEQAEQVLAVARSLANRTSAPAGWNPMAPVIGFSTPNPMPHQLRGGALATLQLERAKQAESDRKRLKLQQQQEKKQKSDQKVEKGEPEQQAAVNDPKRGEIRDHKQQSEQPQRPRQQQQVKPRQEVSMNLSESSSSEDEDEDEDEE